MSNCAIVGEGGLKKFIARYDGIGKPLTRDEQEILMAALYLESEKRGGMVAEAQKDYLKRVLPARANTKRTDSDTSLTSREEQP